MDQLSAFLGNNLPTLAAGVNRQTDTLSVNAKSGKARLTSTSDNGRRLTCMVHSDGTVLSNSVSFQNGDQRVRITQHNKTANSLKRVTTRVKALPAKASVKTAPAKVVKAVKTAPAKKAVKAKEIVPASNAGDVLTRFFSGQY